MIAQAHMPLQFWREAFHLVVFLINKLPLVTLNFCSSYQKILGKIVDYSLFRVIGCAFYPYLRLHNFQKFQLHTTNSVFIGYNTKHKGYKCLDITDRVYIAKKVEFNESSFPFTCGFSLTKQIDGKTTSCNWFTSPLYVVQEQLSTTSSNNNISSTSVPIFSSTQIQDKSLSRTSKVIIVANITTLQIII